MMEELTASGLLTATVRRAGGETEQLVQRNTVTDAGLDLLLSGAFGGGVPAGTWYLAPRGNGPQTPQDTWAARGWSEFTAYTEAARPAWVTEHPQPGVLRSASATALHVASDEAVIRGAFLTDAPGKGEAGRLFMVAGFPRALILYTGDLLELTYELALRRA